MTMILTAYTAFDAGMDGRGITFTGTLVKEHHTIAVDPKVIPLGSWVQIDSKLYRAEDIGGAIKGNRIDVYIPLLEDALEFGVQRKEVKVFKPCDVCGHKARPILTRPLLGQKIRCSFCGAFPKPAFHLGRQ